MNRKQIKKEYKRLVASIEEDVKTINENKERLANILELDFESAMVRNEIVEDNWYLMDRVNENYNAIEELKYSLNN